MSKQVSLWRNTSTPSAIASSYCSLTNGQTWTVTEVLGSHPWGPAGNFSNLDVTLSTAPGVGTSRTFTVRINGVNTALTVTISGTATTARLTGVSVPVTAYQTVSLESSPSGTPAAPNAVTVSIDFDGTVAGQQGYGTCVIDYIGVTRTNRPLWGVDVNNWSNSTPPDLVGIAGTIGGYGVIIDPAVATGSITFSIIKNGVRQDGTGGTVDTMIAYTSGSPTAQQMTFSLPVVAGDTLQLQALVVSATNVTAQWGVLFTATTPGQFMIGAGRGDVNNASPWYPRLTGGHDDISATESLAQLKVGVTPFTLEGLRVHINSSNVSSYQFNIRKNAAATTLAATITAATSATDLANQVTCTDGDLLGMEVTPIGTPPSRSAGWVFSVNATVGLQKVTQFVELVSWGEDADADPPPDVTPCSGNGTVASGTNPSEGTALSTMTTPLAWIEVVVGGTTYRWAATAINDATPKAPRVLKMGRLARGLSDGLGSFESASMRVRLSDHDRLLRGLMNTGVLINQPFSAYVADLATIQAAGTARRIFNGVVRTFRPLSELEFEIEAEDRFTFATSAFASEKKVPARVVTSQISDRNPTERVIGKPVAIILGACSDENEDDPQGVVPLKYIASETPDEYDDNLHKFLACGHALKNVQAIYLANYVSGGDEPTTRIKAPESAYGDVLFVPYQPGWFGAGNYTFQADERYTYVYGLDGQIAIELARSGRIPLLMNCCGLESVGDGSGTMLSNPARCFAIVLNNRLAQEATGDWLSILSLGTYTLFDMTSFEAAATICAARSYLCAGIIGADDQQLDWRELGEWFCTNFDFDWGVNRHGQIILAMLDRSSAYSSANVFTDQNHVLKGSLSIDPKTDEVENEIQYVCRRNYAEALHAINTSEGSRPNRDPYDGKWFSGLLTDPDETVITEMGGRPLGLRQSRVQEYGLIRDTATAEDVARQRRERLKRPRAEVTFTVTLAAGDGVELGDVIKLTHFAGASATGYTTRRLHVRRIEDDLDEFTRQFTCRDVDNLLA